MKGYPKNLNSRKDFDFVIANFPKEKWLPELKGLLGSYQDWFFEKKLESKEDGVTDDTHKVLDDSMEQDGSSWVQYEYRVNPTARIFRLGFTVDEVESLIAKYEG